LRVRRDNPIKEPLLPSKKFYRFYALHFVVQPFARSHELTFESPAEFSIHSVIKRYLVLPGRQNAKEWIGKANGMKVVLILEICLKSSGRKENDDPETA
jgi:hypothetical protein